MQAVCHSQMPKHLIIKTLFLILVFALENAGAECFYQDDFDHVIKVASFDSVPEQHKKYAICPGKKDGESASRNELTPREVLSFKGLAAPDEILLDGTVRSETISSALGKIELRWPRKIEGIFGKNPLRATTDAARTVARAISSPAFPSKIQNIDLPWKIIFIDEEQLANNTIPANLKNNCHPGWMTAPANIYIVAQRVAYNCSREKVPPSEADAAMSQVLIHEIGHALEFHLLEGVRVDPDSRMRAEGFASWFEYYAAEYSSLLSRSKIKDNFLSAARFSLKEQKGNFTFTGSGLDYARASMYFFSIADKRGVRGVLDVYKKMSEANLGFFQAIESANNLSPEQLEKDVARFIENGF